MISCQAYGQVMVLSSHAPTGPTVVEDNLTTSLAAFNAASNNDLVEITQTEHDDLETAFSGLSTIGTYDVIIDFTTNADYTYHATDWIIPANNYPILLQMYQDATGTASGSKLKKSTSTSGTTGFTDYTDIPDFSTDGVKYYIIKNPDKVTVETRMAIYYSANHTPNGLTSITGVDINSGSGNVSTLTSAPAFTDRTMSLEFRYTNSKQW